MPYRLLIVLIIFALLSVAPAPPAARAAPEGFTDELVPGLGNITQPTAVAFTPDGRMLIASQPGRLLVYQNGALLTAPALDLTDRICARGERGLLGVAVDPAFAENGFVYVYYTFNRADSCGTRNRSTDPVNRVARFTLSAANTTSDEVVLVDNIPSPNGNHNAGDLHFGKDGHLYISVGDGGWDYDGGGDAGSNDAARDTHTLLGKILRITRDGGIPSDNPFLGANSARCYDPAPGGNKTGSTTPGNHCRETYSWGLRNPYRMAFDPNAEGVRFAINDVGQGRSEEINLGAAGADYGWNCREGTLSNNTGGPCSPTPSNMVAPIFEYRRNPTPSGQPAHFDGCASITGGAFIPNGVWPTAYDGGYLFADYVCDRIFLLAPGGATSLFVEQSSPTHMVFGPDGTTQALYYTSYGGGDIRRVRYTGSANRSPEAAISADRTSGAAPLTVRFDASGSSDPDAGDPIVEYRWDFGDTQTQTTSTPTVQHTYQDDGAYVATVHVVDSRGAQSATPARLRIDVGNTPPVPTITSPAAGQLFVVGETITLQGGATDADDGPLGPSRLSWEVRRHHGEHDHPYLLETGNGLSLTAPGPEDLFATENSYLEIRLTATDSAGATATITRELRPQLVPLTFRSIPEGMRVTVNGGTADNTVTTPYVLRSWPGYVLELGVPPDQSLNGQPLRFCHWTQGGAASQALTTPEQAQSYYAVFAAEGEPCPSDPSGAIRYYLPWVGP